MRTRSLMKNKAGNRFQREQLFTPPVATQMSSGGKTENITDGQGENHLDVHYANRLEGIPEWCKLIRQR